MPAPEVVWSSVEQIGDVRLVPTAEPVAMEFVAEVLRIERPVVDLTTQAVYLDGAAACADVSWLHPRGVVLDAPPDPTSFVERGVIAPMTGCWNVFYLLMELAAGLHVADRAGVLADSTLVGWLPDDADARLPEAAALFGCTVRPRPGRAGTFARVGELFVPRLWIRPARGGESHFDAPRWSAAGYSRELLDGLRARLLPVPAPDASVVAFGRGPGATDELVPDDVLAACHEAGAVVLPSLASVSLADQALLHVQIRRLVAVHGEANIDVVFLPDGASFDEIFLGGDTPGQFAILADLRGIAYRPTVLDDRSSSASPGVDPASLGALLSPRDGEHAPPPPVVRLLTGVWDNADLLDDWLEHHRALGVAGVLAMDFGSTDGSVELLRSSRWSSFVELVPFPGIDLDDSRYLIDLARERWDTGWAFMIDPDEFLVTVTGDLLDPVLRGAMATSDIVTVPRFEMTAVRSRALAAVDGGPDASDLDLRLVAQDQGKVLIDLASEALPTVSAHGGSGRTPMDLTDPRTCLLHAPVRSFDRFAQKVDHAAVTLSHSSDQDEGFAWHWRRWVAIRAEGGLAAEHLEQFVDDAAIEALLADGTYVRDGRLTAAISRARAALLDPP